MTWRLLTVAWTPARSVIPQLTPGLLCFFFMHLPRGSRTGVNGVSDIQTLMAKPIPTLLALGDEI